MKPLFSEGTGLRIAHTSYDDACSMGTVHSATQMLGWQGHHFSWRLPTEHPDEMIFPADCFSDKALSVCSFAVNSRLALTASSTRGYCRALVSEDLLIQKDLS